MAKQWYFGRDGRQMGPVDLADLKRLANDGQLRPDDLVWKEGMDGWAPAATLEGVFAPARPPAPDAVRAQSDSPGHFAGAPVRPSAAAVLPVPSVPPIPPVPTRPAGRPVNPQLYWILGASAAGGVFFLFLAVLLGVLIYRMGRPASAPFPDRTVTARPHEPFPVPMPPIDGDPPPAPPEHVAPAPAAPAGNSSRERARGHMLQAEAEYKQAQALADADEARYRQQRNTALAQAGRLRAMGVKPPVIKPVDPNLARRAQAARAAYEQAKKAYEQTP